MRLDSLEGSPGGTPLVLLYGQLTDRGSYAAALPGLARHHHVFALDCPGHGTPEHRADLYDVATLGRLLARFVETVLVEPAVLSGHSSGGLVVAWTAAHRPGQVLGAFLEDPPLFTTRPPRSLRPWNHLDLVLSCRDFLEDGRGGDFTAHYLATTRGRDFFGDAGPRLRDAVLRYRAAHPGSPVRPWWAPPAFRETWRALDSYDPWFGAAFGDGSFSDDLDELRDLPRIRMPSVLVTTRARPAPSGGEDR